MSWRRALWKRRASRGRMLRNRIDDTLVFCAVGHQSDLLLLQNRVMAVSGSCPCSFLLFTPCCTEIGNPAPLTTAFESSSLFSHSWSLSSINSRIVLGEASLRRFLGFFRLIGRDKNAKESRQAPKSTSRAQLLKAMASERMMTTLERTTRKVRRVKQPQGRQTYTCR